MGDSPTRLAERLRVEGEKTLDYFATLPEQAWETLIYSEESTWKLHEILAHFVSAEIGFGELIDQILAGGSGAAEDFDLNRFNRSQVMKRQAVPGTELTAQFSQQRAHNINRVARLQPADLERQGRHPFLGMTTLEEIIKMIYRHNQIHQREIRQILAGANFDQPTG